MKLHGVMLYVLCSVLSVANAQNGFSTKERFVMDKALSAIEDYESLCTVSDEDAYYAFIDLFDSDDRSVYNDLIGLAWGDNLKVKEYADIQRKQTQNNQVYISDIKREKIWQENNVWMVQYSFDKTISYSNKCKVYYSSMDYYGEKYHLTAILFFDEGLQACKIMSIQGSSPQKERLSNKIFTLVKSNDNDQKIKYNRKSVNFNRFNQCYLDTVINDKMFGYPDPDVVAVPVIDNDCRLVTMSYKSRRWALSFHYDMGLGDAYSFDNRFTTSSSSGNSFGLDFGFFFPSNHKAKFGFFTGVGISNSKIDLGYDYGGKTHSFETNQDVTGLSYTRYYENLSLSQSYKFTDIVVPLYFELDIPLGRLFSLYFDLGANINFSSTHELENAECSAYVYGIYDKLGNLRMDEHWGYNGFGQKTCGVSDVVDGKLDEANSLTVDARGQIGFKFKIPTTPLSVNFGLIYRTGLTSIIDKKASVSVNGEDESSMIYNTVSGTTSTEHVNSLVNLVDEIKRDQLGLRFGIMYKF